MQEFIEQIVKEIVSGAGELDPVRRRMFLIWLGNHASQVDSFSARQSAYPSSPAQRT